ncbi:MAG: glycosyltransferase family 4 protein [Halobacteriovoraceae bacterium]|nr:glycosyltransferase family 4 protein [Halobacteriovoraceae bacterium]
MTIEKKHSLVITCEIRLYQTPDGKTWTENHFDYEFWQRYLQVFKSMKVVVRVKNVDSSMSSWKRVDGSGVEVVALPYYIGPIGFLKNYFQLKKILKNLVNPNDKYIMRVASVIGSLLQPILVKNNIPYAVEIVGDPWEVFGKGVFHHPLRIFFKYYLTWKLKKICREAQAGSYVTQEVLQKRYPLSSGAMSIGVSTINLKSDDLAKESKVLENDKKEFTLVNIGSLEYMVKGTDILLRSLAILKDLNPQKKFQLKICGDGRYRKFHEELASALKLNDLVEFIGTLPSGNAIRDFLDSGDIFVLPSRSEGLPRVVIEAMSRGLFCLGSNTGGFLELLEEQCRVEVGNAQALAELINNSTDNISQLNEVAARNLEKSKAYLQDILNTRRTQFYQYIANH